MSGLEKKNKCNLNTSPTIAVDAGMLSKQHPDIALSIKTRQAIRSVLNQIRDGIHDLLADGILEEAEGIKLMKVRDSNT